MNNPCIKQTVCKVFNRFQLKKYLVAYVLKKVPEQSGNNYDPDIGDIDGKQVVVNKVFI